MRRALKAVTVAVLIGLLAFFFAPVFYWYTAPTGQMECRYLASKGAYGCPTGVGMQTARVYRSLGCETVGYGDLHLLGNTTYVSNIKPTNWPGLHLGCASAFFPWWSYPPT